MSLLLTVFGALFAASGVTVALLIRRIASLDLRFQPTPAWLDELSIDRYLPMVRMLRSDDFEFMRSELGFTARDLADLRRDRCRIFRGYLGMLTEDFRRISAAIKALMVVSEQDRPDLARVLLRSQIAFGFRALSIHIQLALFRFGVGQVDVAGLLLQFDAVRARLLTYPVEHLGARA